MQDTRSQIDAAIAEGRTGRALSLIRSYWFAEPSLANAPFVLDRIAKTPGRPPVVACRMRILRSFTVEPLLPMVRASAACWGVDLSISLSDFNAYAQEILDPNSDLYHEPVDVLILAVQTRDIAPELWSRAADLSGSEMNAAADRVVQDFGGWIATLRSRTAAHLILHLLEQPAHPAAGIYDAQRLEGQSRAISRINEELVRLADEFPGVHVLDYDALVARHGRERWFDEKKWLTARMPIAAACLRHLVDQWIRYLLPLCGRQAKCLACDLDNTLWGGIIGEDGLHGIKLGADYPGAGFQQLQRAMLDLARRGVLLAICSKNNEADALEALRSHPEMLLRPDDFAILKINWQDKAQNLREIAAELNIGLDSLVLIDDNPVEREFVREVLPEVAVIDIDDSSPLKHAEALRSCPLFERLDASAEDRERSRMYSQQRERRQLESSAATVEDYLRSLEMTAEFGLADESTRQRVAQLTQKTNQLNATTRRYSEQEIQSFIQDPSAHVYWVRVLDRFGDNGIVGVMIVRDANGAWELDTFLMSCRVIGRTIEQTMLAFAAEEARRRGVKRLVGHFIPTAKNAPARDIYAANGFDLVEEQQNGQSSWQLDLATASLRSPEWIQLRVCDTSGNGT